MKSAQELEMVTIFDSKGRSHIRPGNPLYRKVAERQSATPTGSKSEGRMPLLKVDGEPLSQTILRERQGDFD
jgi:hypothetical protein